LAAAEVAAGAGMLLLVLEETEGILERGMATLSEKKGVKFYLTQEKKSHFWHIRKLF
jgi:hypothetical protein